MAHCAHLQESWIIRRTAYDVFRGGLRELGYIEGKNLIIDQRSAEGKLERLPSFLTDLIALHPDVIVAITTPAIAAAGDQDNPPQSSTQRTVSHLHEAHREVLAPMDRAEEKAEPKDVGEQALMRGLDTAFPFFRLGLSLV